jgi:UDP-N-acetyl-D-mannosaminuronic acid dehydrogenase
MSLTTSQTPTTCAAVEIPSMSKTIVVIGTGYVGLPAALMWARAGQKVIGVDINENVVRAINERTMLLNEQELHNLLNDPTVQKNLKADTRPCLGDVFVIAVPTPVDHLKKVCDMRPVQAAVESICPFLRKGNLVILESTVPGHTCSSLSRANPPGGYLPRDR